MRKSDFTTITNPSIPGLSRQQNRLRQQLERPTQPHPLQPQTRLRWRRCAGLPVGMWGAQSVQVGGKVYIGAGYTASRDDAFLVFQYDPDRDGWATLPPCPVKSFALGHFKGHIITVGGVLRRGGDRTNKLHCYKEDSQEWEEFLLPMPAARSRLSVITTQSAIIACGGRDTEKSYASVKVYTVETGQWHAADPLPIRCDGMTSITIADTCYLLGGFDNSDEATRHVLSAPISSLVEKATSPHCGLASIFNRSLWSILQDTPLNRSTAACLSGCLLAVGGCEDRHQYSPAVHMFQPQTTGNSWVRMTSGDLLIAAWLAAAIQLPDNKLLVCGGYTGTAGVLYTKNVYMASITHS